MNKTQVITEIIRATADEPTIFTTGFTCRIANSIADRANHFYMVGSMGLAADIGIGVALFSELPVIVVDGDGSLAMNPGCLLTGGAIQGLRLMHLVLDDGVYESTGSQNVPSIRLDFCALAAAAGYPRVWSMKNLSEFSHAFAASLGDPGPTFIRCLINTPEHFQPPPRIEFDLARLHDRFAGHLLQQLSARRESQRLAIRSRAIRSAEAPHTPAAPAAPVTLL